MAKPQRAVNATRTANRVFRLVSFPKRGLRGVVLLKKVVSALWTTSGLSNFAL